MGIKNRNIDRAWETKYMGLLDFANGVLEASNQLTGVGAGDPIFAEFNSLGIVGAKVGAEGDIIETYFPWPSEMDTTEPIYSRVHFGYTAASAQAITFKLHYLAQTRAAAGSITSMTAISYDARTTAATANQINWTEWKLHSPGTFFRDYVYILALECDDWSSASADQVYVFGLEWKFKRSLSY